MDLTTDQSMRIIKHIEKAIEPKPTPNHKFGRFQISSWKKNTTGKGFPYSYAHKGMATLEEVKSLRFIETLKLQPSPQVYLIRSNWMPAVRGKGVKPRRGKNVLHFSYQKFVTGIKVTVHESKTVKATIQHTDKSIFAIYSL